MRIVLFVCLLLTAAIARAEDIASYEMEGEADAGGNDPRVAALDDAFSRAVAQAVGELVDGDVRKTNKATIDKEIIGRARLWVAKFTVNKDYTNGDRRELTVLVRIDRDKMRARLAELSIPSTSAGEQPAAGGKSVVMLVRIVSPEGTRVSYGVNAEKQLPGTGAFASALRSAGMTTKKAPAAGPAAKPGGDLPFEDDEAQALANDAKAEAAAVAGVTVGEPVMARGVSQPGVLVTAHVKIVQQGKAIGHGMAVLAARGTDPSVIAVAIERALVAAVSDVLPPAKPTLSTAPTFSGEDVPIAQDGVVLVRLAPKTPWGLVVAEQKFLAGAKGVQRAVIRRLSPGGWVIGVHTTESIERIQAIAKKAPTSDTSVKVKIVGNIVEVTLSGSP